MVDQTGGFQKEALVGESLATGWMFEDPHVGDVWHERHSTWWVITDISNDGAILVKNEYSGVAEIFPDAETLRRTFEDKTNLSSGRRYWVRAAAQTVTAVMRRVR